MSAHALLSASGSSRWMKCTPSAVLESKLPESTSKYAEEGTLAHEIGELMLRRHNGELKTRKYNSLIKKHMENELYSEELLINATSYANFVIERHNNALSQCSDAILSVEAKLDFSRYVPEGFGTGDAVIIYDGNMEIIDLKYGKGVPVYADNNSQMMLYALGALEEFSTLYKIDLIEMTIYQPRLDNISRWGIEVQELITWAESELKPKADLAIKGEGEFVSGSHCKFCKLKSTCRARAEKNLEMAKFEFKKPELLTESEISQVLKQAKELKAWADDIWDFAFDAALNGQEWDGFKLVEGRSVRKYADENKVIGTLESAGYKDIYDVKLKGITAMEKQLSKAVFNELLKDLVVKPEGKPVLVESTDKREQINSAAKDFNIIE